MLRAAIDIGTNSTRLLIARIKDGRVSEELLRLTKITRLGAGVNSSGILKEAAIKRTIKALIEYRNILDKYQVDKVSAVATSAARDAKNTDYLITEAVAESGINIKVIDGRAEARLCFQGATSDYSLVNREDDYLVIDIGGGSVELIYGGLANAISAYTLNAGCVRLTEMFLRDDPPSQSSVVSLRKFVSDKLADEIPQDFTARVFRGTMALAVAGTSTSLVSIDLKLPVYDPKIIHGAKMSRRRVEGLLKKLSQTRLEQLRRVIGLQPERADVIIAGAAIQAEIMSYFKLEELTVSERDILDGIILNNISS